MGIEYISAPDWPFKVHLPWPITLSVRPALPVEMLNNGNPARPLGVRPSDIEISHQNPRIMYLSGSHGSVYRTNDGGASWTKVLSGSSLPE